jgi:hypothetical protein
LTAWFDSIDSTNNLKVNRFCGISYAKAQAFFIVSARFMQSFLNRFVLKLHSFSVRSLFVFQAIKKDPSRIAPQGVMLVLCLVLWFFCWFFHTLLFHAWIGCCSFCHQPASTIAMQLVHRQRTLRWSA